TSGEARCQGNFQGCPCNATPNTCGVVQNCDRGGCNGSFDSGSNTARCRGNFPGCVCNPVTVSLTRSPPDASTQQSNSASSTCGRKQSCSLNGCNGGFNDQGNAVCMTNFYGCPCIPNPIWIPRPPTLPPYVPPPPTQPPLQNPWYCVGLSEDDDCGFGGCTHRFELVARNMNAGTQVSGYLTGIGHSTADLCGATLGGATIICQGDITAQCSDYGVALYNSRSCRTFCPDLGDLPFCWQIFNGVSAFELAMDLICDRALS
ncbi:hypothetical protein BKA67DRAFT_511880, partial [Truncatella angustata]